MNPNEKYFYFNLLFVLIWAIGYNEFTSFLDYKFTSLQVYKFTKLQVYKSTTEPGNWNNIQLRVYVKGGQCFKPSGKISDLKTFAGKIFSQSVLRGKIFIQKVFAGHKFDQKNHLNW